MPDIHRIASRFYNTPLWLQPAAAETISAFLLTRMSRPSAGRGEIDSGSTTQVFRATPKPDGSAELHAPRASRFYAEYRIGADGRPKPYPITPDGVAIITVVGELVHRGAYVGASSGIVTYEGFSYQIRQAAKDPAVRNIVIDMESPGGEATGAFEAAAVVRQVAKIKPVHAVVNGLAASAGYALVSGATRIITMPTGVSGSIGVVLLHLDFSAQADTLGVKPTYIFAGAHKVDGNPFEPLPAAVRDRLQAAVSSYYEQFVKTVAAGRRKLLSADAVRRTEAKTFKGQDAIDAGLADGLGDLESVLADLSPGKAGATRRPTIAAPAATPKQASGPRSTPAQAPRSTPPAASTAVPSQADRIAAIKANVDKMRKAYAHAPPLPPEAEQSGTPAAGATPQPQLETPIMTNTTPGTPDGWRAEYAAQDAKGASLRAEFPSAESYVSYCKAVSAGRVRVHAPGLAPIAAATPRPAIVHPGPTAAADDEALRRVFDAATPEGASLRAEFGNNFAAFSAYWRASQRGAAKIIGGTVVSR